MMVALVAAVVTGFIVPPDKEYLGYFDVKTLTCLFCVLAVVCALKNIGFFYTLAKQIVIIFRDSRMCILALVYITFIGSMLIANDMALLTFLPQKGNPYPLIMQVQFVQGRVADIIFSLPYVNDRPLPHDKQMHYLDACLGAAFLQRADLSYADTRRKIRITFPKRPRQARRYPSLSHSR